MNRLILIGNGFDLAHGMKTEYKDFIKCYLCQCLNQADEFGGYEDDLLHITNERKEKYAFSELKNSKMLIDFCYEKGVLGKFFRSETVLYSALQYLNNPYKFRFKSLFLSKLIDNCSIDRWVVIENEYYEALKGILHKNNVTEKKRLEELNILNRTLSYIIKRLHEYLADQQPPAIQEEYFDILRSPTLAKEILGVRNLKDDEAVNCTHLLVFNYTSTIENYLDNQKLRLQKAKMPKVNYIHGKLNDPKNPIIFGFGDELDADYQKMELEKTNSFFEYIKSFWYFKTSNYHDLVRFIDSDDFQVFILGHSCGLSDRTMLNMIFEHSQCKSIKIFYHGTEERNNYTELTHEISRHFRNKEEMRKKIVPFDKSIIMPQLTT